MLLQLNENKLEQLKMLFMSAHALAKHTRPFTDFVWQCALDEVKGLNIGHTYRNDKSAQSFIHAIAQTERQKLKKEVEEAPFIALLSDGATDSAILEEEVVYVRYANKGKISCRLVGLQSVERADASSIKQAIERCMTEKLQLTTPQWSPKLVGFGSDGAAVMVGRNNGVAAKLRELQPCMQSVHCFNHRLELAFKSCCKSVTMLSRLEEFLLGIYYFYHNSPLNRSNLKRSFESLGKSPLMPTRVGGTRWLPHIRRAIDNIMRGEDALLAHLEQVSFKD
jgi:hypothetical protein